MSLVFERSEDEFLSLICCERYHLELSASESSRNSTQAVDLTATQQLASTQLRAGHLIFNIKNEIIQGFRTTPLHTVVNNRSAVLNVLRYQCGTNSRCLSKSKAHEMFTNRSRSDRTTKTGDTMVDINRSMTSYVSLTSSVNRLHKADAKHFKSSGDSPIQCSVSSFEGKLNGRDSQRWAEYQILQRTAQIVVLWWNQWATPIEGETKNCNLFLFQMSKDTVSWATQSG